VNEAPTANGAVSADVTVERDGFVLRVTLRAAPGEVVVVVGPNGAGKTTLVRALAGLTPLSAGKVVVGDEVMEDRSAGVFVPPERRGVGVVFQDHRLFEHMSALDNVAYGLRSRSRWGPRLGRRSGLGSGLGASPRSASPRSWLRSSRRAARARASLALGAVGLDPEMAARTRPGTLSGGQRQRVALARALAIEPRLLLLDEPLASVDLAARPELRRLLTATLRAYATGGAAQVLATHDPLDALTLAQRVVVLEGGRVTQEGTVAEVTARPRSAWVADFVGVNLLRGRSTGTRSVALDGGGTLAVTSSLSGDVFAVVRPRTVTLHRTRPEGSARNVWRGPVEAVEEVPGGAGRARVRVSSTPALVAEVTMDAVNSLRLCEGGTVWASVKATEVEAYAV